MAYIFNPRYILLPIQSPYKQCQFECLHGGCRFESRPFYAWVDAGDVCACHSEGYRFKSRPYFEGLNPVILVWTFACHRRDSRFKSRPCEKKISGMCAPPLLQSYRYTLYDRNLQLSSCNICNFLVTTTLIYDRIAFRRLVREVVNENQT